MTADTAHSIDAAPQSATAYVGTSGWSYTIWKPDFYPKNVASKNFLNYYATRLNAVEVNFTFRMRLQEKTALGWMAAVGPNFRFALKANQFITHIRRLNNVGRAVATFSRDAPAVWNAARPSTVSASTELKVRCWTVAQLSCAISEELPVGVRVSSRVVVQRRGLPGAARLQCGAVYLRDGEVDHARSSYRELHLLPLARGELFRRRSESDCGESRASPRPRP